MEIKRVNILFKLCKMHPYSGIVETGRAVDCSGGGRESGETCEGGICVRRLSPN